MQVLVAMSGGVDSSVAAALMLEGGHDVVGVTMKLWGGDSDSGCCSAADVVDARRAADMLGIDHHVFNFGDDFDNDVVEPYVEAHQRGRTPNPCIECNRSIKFKRLLLRADALGFDAVATGHHARIVTQVDGTKRLKRAVDTSKDQSYVLHMLSSDQMERTLFPVGELMKSAVRQIATDLGLRVATKPDSQDVCFISSLNGRRKFLDERIKLTPGRVVDQSGRQVGHVDAVELVTVGQRKGLGTLGGAAPRYANHVDIESRTITVGEKSDLLCDFIDLDEISWVGDPRSGPVLVQTSAHGRPRSAIVEGCRVWWTKRSPRVAGGQTAVVYLDDLVLGGGTVARSGVRAER